MALCWLVWIFLCQKVQISCVGNTVLSKLSLICKQNQAEFVAVVAAIHIIAQSLCDLPVKGVVLYEAYINHHGAEFFVPVPVLHQLHTSIHILHL
jgi:hypothetical protein